MPQYFILTTLAITKGGLQWCDMKNISQVSFNEQDYSGITCGGGNLTYNMTESDFYHLMGESINLFGILHVPMNFWFKFSYKITFLSCTFGILRFLDIGPTRILARDGWRNYVGYGIAFLSVLHSVHTKALGLGADGTILRIFANPTGYGK